MPLKQPHTSPKWITAALVGLYAGIAIFIMMVN